MNDLEFLFHLGLNKPLSSYTPAGAIRKGRTKRKSENAEKTASETGGNPPTQLNVKV